PPAQQVVGEGRVGPRGGDVAGPAGDDLVGDVPPDGPGGRRAPLQPRVPAPGAQVDGPASGAHGLDRGHEPGGQVDDVEGVADPGAVTRRVVVAEHPHVRVPAGGDLHDVRHQVVGDAARVLADAAARMGAHRVEVAEEQRLPAVVGGRHVADHVL